MIEIYTEVAQVLKQTDSLRWIDTAPRVPEHTNIYPAAYISVDEEAPMNPLGGYNGLAEVAFSVEYWLKPYHSSTIEPLSPAIADLTTYLALIATCRRAIMDWQGEAVQNTTLKSEIVDKQEDGFYRILQKWQCLSSMWGTEFAEIPLPPPVFAPGMQEQPA